MSIVGWRPGVRTIDLINKVKDLKSCRLGVAKREVDLLLASGDFQIGFEIDADDWEEVVRELNSIGVDVEISEGN
ncbi:hypothetical protein RA26_20055 [Leisingera sp. ANG-M7]|nr:hypothetical protein RA26_20055 [Leisingera sp. ANG-M7]